MIEKVVSHNKRKSKKPIVFSQTGISFKFLFIYLFYLIWINLNFLFQRISLFQMVSNNIFYSFSPLSVAIFVMSVFIIMSCLFTFNGANISVNWFLNRLEIIKNLMYINVLSDCKWKRYTKCCGKIRLHVLFFWSHKIVVEAN